MQRDTLKKFYIVHSWVGVITGILLFIICFSGALSVFGSPDLKLWSNPSLHTKTSIDPAAIDQLVERYAVDVPEALKHEVMVLLPGAEAFGDLYIWFESEHGPEEQAIALHFDPSTLELIERLEGNPEVIFAQSRAVLTMEQFITQFHANLHMGKLGLILTGLLGLTLMASIVTGLIIHRKILKEMFTFRPWRSLRLMLTDTHKVLSVWGILFHGMIGFTGAFLGLATIILLPAAALVSFQGDQEKLLETFQPEHMPRLSGEPANMSIDKVLRHSLSLGGVTRSIIILGWGDKNALAFTNTVNVDGTGEMASETHNYQLSSGKHLARATAFEMVGGVSGPVLDLIAPLHFGAFGGLTVRIIWGLLGLSTALIAATGIMIWVERRAYGAEGKLSPENYLRLNKFTIGSCSGLVLACASLFWSQRLAPEFIMALFFCVWAMSIPLAFSMKNNYQSNRLLLGLSGAMLMCVPFIDALTLEHHLFNSLDGSHNHLAAIDATLLCIGLALLGIAKRLPRARREEQHKKGRGTKALKPSNEEVADDFLEDQPPAADIVA